MQKPQAGRVSRRPLNPISVGGDDFMMRNKKKKEQGDKERGTQLASPFNTVTVRFLNFSVTQSEGKKEVLKIKINRPLTFARQRGFRCVYVRLVLPLYVPASREGVTALGARILDGKIEQLLGDNGVLDVNRFGVVVERWGLAQDRKCAE